MKAETKKINHQLILVSVAATLLVIDLMLVFVWKDPRLDNSVFELISPYRNSLTTDAMLFISFYGNHLFLLPANLLLIAYFIAKKNNRMAVTAMVTGLSSYGIMFLLKNLLQRERPAGPLVAGITNFSFPSGHALMGVAFYGLLIWMALHHIQDKKKQYAVIFFLLLLLLLIGFSRIYLGVHFASDVVAGYCAGIIWLLFILKMRRKIR